MSSASSGYGLRDCFGMAFDPASGAPWTQEYGEDAFDELNCGGPAMSMDFNGLNAAV